MADRGAIGSKRDHYGYAYDPLSYTGAGLYVPRRQDGSISGTTRVAGVATGDVEIWLLWRPTMVPIKRTFSASDGTFSFTGLATSTTSYAIYAKDLPTGTVYNDVVYALIDTTP